jgi:hypothetical protein
MTRNRSLLVPSLFLALAVAAAPSVAFARAGDGGSMGSRGSQTYSAPPATKTAPTTAAPMQRSMTPQAPQQGAAQPGFAQQQQQQRSGGFGSGLMGGLMGGLIGVGIGGMLFGHGFMGGGMGGLGFLGLLLQIGLVFLLVRFLWKLFAGSAPRPAVATGPGMFAREAMPGAAYGGGGGGGAPAGPPPIQVGPGDYQQFEQLLKGVQAAWSAQDLNGLRAMATPEMVSYFSEQLSDQASRGVRNLIGDVRLESGDLSQAWAEGGREYATVAMRFSMTDVTKDVSGRVVDGSPTEHVTATEIWTFVRAQGGHWVLSAIQQAR